MTKLFVVINFFLFVLFDVTNVERVTARNKRIMTNGYAC